MQPGKFPALVAPDESSNILVTSKRTKEKLDDFQRRGFTHCGKNPCHRRFIVHDEEIRAVSVVRVNHAITAGIQALVVVGGSTNETKVHVELGAGLIYLASLSTGSALTDPRLYFPVYVSERVEFKRVR
jgi:hypothetical protein